MTIIDTLKAVVGIQTEPEVVVQETSRTDSIRLLTEDEVTKYVERVFVPDIKSASKIGDISEAISPVHESMVNKILDSDRIFQIAPEIEHAAAILIPSILAPNDLKPFTTSLSLSNSTESNEVVKDIVTSLNEFFGKRLKINDKLPTWLNEVIFTKGAKPLLILPEHIISNMRNNSMILSEVHANESLFTNATLDIDELNESIFQGLLNEGFIDSSKDASFLKATPDHSPISFTTNIYALATTTDVRTKEAIVASTESLNYLETSVDKLKIKTDTLVDFTDLDDGESYLSSLIELPYESVIPITLEGSPHHHVGYFVMLNNNGYPVSVTDSNDRIYRDFNNMGDKQIKKMFDAVYNNSSLTCSMSASTTKTKILDIVFNSYIKTMLKNQASGHIDVDIDIDMSQSILKMMMFRLFRNKKTKLLFIPPKYLKYMAIWYNDDGTGRSKIENIKFPLSLKLNLIISRLMALTESAVNRKKLNITFNDNVPNPFELLRTIRKEYLKKNQFGLNYDPNMIISSMADKQLTFVPNNLPGISDFSIDTENNQVDYPTPDDSLLEEINNMYMLSLDIPPNALNRLSEDEFSSSVVTNNIFLANKILMYQQKICSVMTDVIKTMIMTSEFLRNELKRIVSESSGEEHVNDLDKRIGAIVSSIEFNLAPPNISNLKAHFEELENYISLIDNVLDILYTEELVDSDDRDNINQIKAVVKRQMILDFMKDNQIVSSIDFPDISGIDINSLGDISVVVKNVKHMMEAIKNKTSGEDSSSGSKW